MNEIDLAECRLLRGMAFGFAAALPIWAGIGVLVWELVIR